MNIRRSAAAAVTAAAICLLPATAAFGYGSDAYPTGVAVSDTRPAIGEEVTVGIQGGPANTLVMLTLTSEPASHPDSVIAIAGTRSHTRTTDATGAASWTVTLSAAGTYQLSVTDTVSGAVLGTDTLVVTDVAAADTAGLAITGSAALPAAGVAAGLVLAGAGTVLVVRRRAAARAH